MPLNECAFCEPEQLADRVIDESDLALAFLSNPRLTPGHSLVVPRRHVELRSQLTPEEVLAIHELVVPIHAKLLASAVALGVEVWEKSRPHVAEDGFKMDHLHTHVIPSVPGTELYEGRLDWSRERFGQLETEEAEFMLAILRPTT